MSELAGIILAGGESRRFGSDKALATIAGVPMIARIARLLGEMTGSLVIVSNRSDGLRPALVTVEQTNSGAVRFVGDIVAGLGPLGGLWSGLTAIKADSALVLSCDVPFVQPALLRLLVAGAGDHDAVVPRWLGKPEPLVAWYRARCAMQAGDLLRRSPGASMRDLLDRLNVRYLDEPDYQAVDPTGQSFRNINRPDDLATAPSG